MFPFFVYPLVCLHWMRVPERVEYKIAVLTYRVLCGIAPRYLGPLNRVADVSGRRSLRSSGTNRLVVPPFRLSTVGSRAFPERAAGQSGRNGVTTDVPAPFEDISVSAFFSIALQWTWQ